MGYLFAILLDLTALSVKTPGQHGYGGTAGQILFMCGVLGPEDCGFRKCRHLQD